MPHTYPECNKELDCIRYWRDLWYPEIMTGSEEGKVAEAPDK